MGKEEARRQGSAKARGGRARRTRWARREADGSGVPITAIVHVVPRPSHLTRGALVRPVGAARAALARANLARAAPARAALARTNLAGLAPPRRPARRHAALRLGEVATRPTHAVMVPILPRLRASGAELRAARRRIALTAPPFAVVAVVPARPLVRRRHCPAALVRLACGAGARLPRRRHVVVDHAHFRALSVVEGVLARWLAALVLIAHAIRAPVIIHRAARGAAGGGALAAATVVAVVAPARRPALRVAALILIAHAIRAPVIIHRAARGAAGGGALAAATGVAVVAPARRPALRVAAVAREARAAAADVPVLLAARHLPLRAQHRPVHGRGARVAEARGPARAVARRAAALGVAASARPALEPILGPIQHALGARRRAAVGVPGARARLPAAVRLGTSAAAARLARPALVPLSPERRAGSAHGLVPKSRQAAPGHAALGPLRAPVAAVVSVRAAPRLCRRGALVAAALVARAAPPRRPARPPAALARLHAPACRPPWGMGVTAR